MAIQWSDDTIILATKSLYGLFCLKWGEPQRPLQQLLVGNLNYDRPEHEYRWGECAQCQGKSHIYYDNSLLGESDDVIIDVICHELAHVWVGCYRGHGKLFQSFHKKFKKYAKKVLTK